MNNQKKYRPNVGLMIVNEEGRVWLGERAHNRRHPHTLQMPQGGIDLGETPHEAAYRELREETGLTPDKVTLIEVSQNWRSYDFPRPLRYGNHFYHGQSQKWFLFLFHGQESDFNLMAHPEEIEFSNYKWEDTNNLSQHVIPFKKVLYENVLEEFQPALDKLKAKYKKALD